MNDARGGRYIVFRRVEHDESPHRGCGRTEGNYIQPEERAGQSLRLVTDPERNPVQRAKRETNLTEYRGGGGKDG